MSINSQVLSIDNIVDIKNNTKNQIVDVNMTYTELKNNKKKTRPYYTKFEKGKLKAIRAQQIYNGMEPMVKLKENETNIENIVERELKEKKIPLMIRRYLPDNTFEDWRIHEFLN